MSPPSGTAPAAGLNTGAGADAGHPILALGAWFKHAACLLEADGWSFGPNLGDLDNANACAGVEPAVHALLAQAAGPVRAVAHDLHPDFHSTRVALATAARLGVPAIGVQHHHAHVGAVLAEHGRFDARPVLGLALDGVGLGTDGEAWGGELLVVAGGQFQRLGRLRPLRLPGGDRAAREPWRMAAALLHAGGRGAEIATRFAQHTGAAMLAQVIERPALSPHSSSRGRPFDAAAGLLGLCDVMQFEAEAAIALEKLAAQRPAPAVDPAHWRIADAPSIALELDLHPLLLRLADETDAALGAARFQATLAVALEDWVARAATRTGCTSVVLFCGGLHNRLLADALSARLPARGLETLGALRLSPGDGGLALGQAWVARDHRTKKAT